MVLITDVQSIPIENLQDTESNARKLNTYENIHELATNIRQNGLIHPLIVKKNGDKFDVIIGQRRLKACKMLNNMSKIPCRLLERSSSEHAKILSLSENIFRLKMEAEDISDICNDLYKKMNSIHKVAQKIGVTSATAKKYIGYYSVPDEIKQIVNNKKLGASKALEIYTMFESHDEQIKIAEHLSKLTKLDEKRAFKRSISISNPYDKLQVVRDRAKKIKGGKEVRIFINSTGICNVIRYTLLRIEL